MASIIDVAKYIIHKFGHLSPLRIEYLCYYSQAWSLAWYEVPIFYEDFYVLPLGPISPVLHEALSDYDYFSFNFLDEYDSNALDEMQIYCIDKVLRGYIDLAPEKFMALPVNEAPWSRAYKKGDAIISKETLLDYYAGLLVPDKMKDKIQVEMGSPRCFEENNSHRNMADDQVASVSESPNDIDEEKNKLIEERNKLVEETNKLIEETNKLIEETNQVNVPIRRWKRSRKKLKRKLKANYGRDRLAYASERK